MKREVWLIEDNSVYRRNVARAIDRIEGFSCMYQFGSFEEALPVLQANPGPDIILLDVGLPGVDGIQALRQIHSLRPDTKVIILTVFDDSEKIMRAICAGVSGYLLKTSKLAAIRDAMHQALEGGAPMTPKIARRVLDLFSAMTPVTRPERYNLTEREREILQLMVEGLVKKEIGARLGLSVHTVSAHLRSIYEKLRVNTNTGAVAKALREKVI
jgi:DNA-binding NarL/FixJ family response regulator